MTVDFASPLPPSIVKIGLRQRNMGHGDATIKKARLTVDGTTFSSVVDFSSPTPSCAGGTCLTTPSLDAYGRHGLAEEVFVTGIPSSAQSVTFEVLEVHPYSPPEEMMQGNTAEETRWGVTKMETQYPTFYKYVHPTMGTWNVGLTAITFYDSTDTPVDRSHIDSATVTAPNSFDAPGVLEPHFPLLHSYETSTVSGTGSTQIHRSWCWNGHGLLHGSVDGYGFLGEETTVNAPPSSPSLPSTLPEAVGEPQ